MFIEVLYTLFGKHEFDYVVLVRAASSSPPLFDRPSHNRQKGISRKTGLKYKMQQACSLTPYYRRPYHRHSRCLTTAFLHWSANTRYPVMPAAFLLSWC